MVARLHVNDCVSSPLTLFVASTLRHPAYFGFFWWSVGTQLLLCNPLCVVAYAAASWHFFSGRIRCVQRFRLGLTAKGGDFWRAVRYEEGLLRQFFGARYVEYCSRTTVGIPFL